MDLRKWLASHDRKLAESVVKAIGLTHAMQGVGKSLEPYGAKEAAAKGDFATAIRYKHFLDVLQELDEMDNFVTAKVTL